MSFAIPIDIAMDVAQQLRTSGKVARSRSGVQAQELTRGLAASFGLQEPRGAQVANVVRGGPAGKAGQQPGDIALSLNGQPVQSLADLARLVAGVKPGTTVTAEIWRKGRNVPIKITTVELAAPAPAAGGDATLAAKAGLYLSEIPTMQRRSLGIEGGVLVHRAEGAALRAGIQPGDLILRFNDVSVRGVSQWNRC
ncbi:PDZ domain-containing protein (plasmid) [Cupriavidus sp. KK10]|uniref:PDZ domain-containing protein n=1 Tax=Cupriavidus sp. KK10 TaxID=1478019 RepID=UPI001BA75599|nr:PDZ domain-containing protein [Cupriavidus sp. KK10]QUN31758.1 PDZ domain-containing protein [Cupriavidus sp. KK10]